MPNVSYETRVLSVELVARVTDISEETANRIKGFISAEIGKTNAFETDESRRAQLIRLVTESKSNGIRHKAARIEGATIGILYLRPEYIDRKPDGKKVNADDFMTELGKKFCNFLEKRTKKTKPISLFDLTYQFSHDEVNELLRWKEERIELSVNDENSLDNYVRALREEASKIDGEHILEDVLSSRRKGITLEEAKRKRLAAEEKPSETVEPEENHESLANKKERVKNACSSWMWELAEKFFQMFEWAEENPEAVTNKWITAHDIGKKLFGGEYDAYLIGNVLGHCFRAGAVQRRKKNGATGANEYLIPIPKSEPAKEPEETAIEQEVATPEISVEETSKPDTVSDRLREYRERSGLSIADVADLIKYPESVVKAWEAGTNVPSSEGKAQLESLFGKHIFDGVQKPVIW